MRISKKSRYAVDTMVNLALNDSEKPMTLAFLGERQGISFSYLEQIMAKLRGRGLVRGVRGPGGGYYLADTPDAITIGQIICAVDGQNDLNDADKIEKHLKIQICESHVMWDDLSRQIYDFLSEISLDDLVRQRRRGEDAPEAANTRKTTFKVTKQAA